LPGRTLEASAHDESDRVHVRDGPVARRRDEGGRLPHRGAGDGVQAAARGRRSLAQRRRGRARTARARRRAFRGRSADRAAEEAREEGRRLISLNPQLLTIAQQRWCLTSVSQYRQLELDVVKRSYLSARK